MKVSIIIPVYNEEAVIGNCLASLDKQTIKIEVIVVDDGSTDATASVISNFKFRISNFVVLRQNHGGPGAARNLGASKATGEILVFVDADMEFESDFITKLTAPIVSGKTIGTFSKDEYLLNKNKPLARCWNLNLGRKVDKMEPRDYVANGNSLYQLGKSLWQKIEGTKVSFEKDKSHVFRAIFKEKFDSVGGFDTTVGYTDDWSLSEKLGAMATVAPGAKYYHRNPETYAEVWKQARWFGKNEFLTKNLIRCLYSFVRYNPILAIVNGLIGLVKYSEPQYLPFKIIYDTGVFVSILLSFANENKYK